MKSKSMNKETKENLKNVFGSLINNTRAIEGARHNPWWVAIIFFFLSIILATIPTFVGTINAYGSSFLSSSNRDMDTQITYFVEDTYKSNVSLKINNEGKLEPTGWIEKYTSDIGENKYQYARINENSNQYDFLVYYSSAPIDEINSFMQSDLANRKFRPGTRDLINSDDKEFYTPSFLVLGTSYFFLQVYSPNTNTSAGGMSGDYVNYKNLDLVDWSKDLEHRGNNLENYPDEVKAVFTNFKIFLDKGYLTTKNQMIAYRNLLALGIYAVVVLFMGLMIFLLTRGKNNVLRVYTFWDSLKISMWAGFSPAILSLIMGFIISSYALMFFILFFGVRIMWLSMKNLKPNN